MRVISLKISSAFRSLVFNGVTFTINISIPKLDNYINDIYNNGEEVMNTITIAKNSLLNKNIKVSKIEEFIEVSMFR
jgi:hypothetical protein